MDRMQPLTNDVHALLRKTRAICPERAVFSRQDVARSPFIAAHIQAAEQLGLATVERHQQTVALCWTKPITTV